MALTLPYPSVTVLPLPAPHRPLAAPGRSSSRLRVHQRGPRCLARVFLGLTVLGLALTAFYGMVGLGRSEPHFSGRLPWASPTSPVLDNSLNSSTTRQWRREQSREGGHPSPADLPTTSPRPSATLTVSATSSTGPRATTTPSGSRAEAGSQQGEARKEQQRLAAKFRRVLAWAGSGPVRGDPHWQQLDPEFRAFVYAAHYDDVSLPPVVRVVGFYLAHLPPLNVTCRLFYGSPSPAHTSGTLYQFRPKNGRRYVGAYVDCPLPEGFPRFPTAVTVFVKEASSNTTHSGDASSLGLVAGNGTERNYLDIHYSHSQAWLRSHSAPEPLLANLTNGKERVNKLRALDLGWRWNLTRCTPAIQMGFNDHVLLAQMVAVSSAMGVDHFVFYVQSAGPDVLRMLQVLVDRGVAEVHPWNLNIAEGDLTYAGQFPAIQDCLYRNLWSSRFVLFGDIDEMFVPREEKSLFHLLLNTFQQEDSCACLLFRNTFYNLYYSTQIPPTDVDPLGLSLRHRLALMTHTRREERIYPPSARSKVAVDPHRTLTGSIHIIQTPRTGFKSCNMNMSRGLLHHYRRMMPVSNQTVDDPFLWRFSDPILSTLDTLLTHFNNTVLGPLTKNILGL